MDGARRRGTPTKSSTSIDARNRRDAARALGGRGGPAAGGPGGGRARRPRLRRSAHRSSSRTKASSRGRRRAAVTAAPCSSRAAGGRTAQAERRHRPARDRLAVEHYGRIVRTLEKKVPVTLELDVKNTFHDDDTTSFNIIGEIPGHRQGRRGRDARRALRLVARRHRRDRQRRRLGGDDGGDAHPQGSRRCKLRRTVRIGALDRRRAGPARLARLREARTSPIRADDGS